MTKRAIRARALEAAAQTAQALAAAGRVPNAEMAVYVASIAVDFERYIRTGSTEEKPKRVAV